MDKDKSSIKIIESCIEHVQDRNITLVRGPRFIWSFSDIPEACDWCGAVLLAHNNAKPGFEKGWLKEFLDLFDKNIIWFYKFNFGWSQNRSLETRVEHHDNKCRDGGEKYIWVEEKISKSAVDLSRKYL